MGLGPSCQDLIPKLHPACGYSYKWAPELLLTKIELLWQKAQLVGSWPIWLFFFYQLDLTAEVAKWISFLRVLCQKAIKLFILIFLIGKFWQWLLRATKQHTSFWCYTNKLIINEPDFLKRTSTWPNNLHLQLMWFKHLLDLWVQSKLASNWQKLHLWNYKFNTGISISKLGPIWCTSRASIFIPFL